MARRTRKSKRVHPCPVCGSPLARKTEGDPAEGIVYCLEDDCPECLYSYEAGFSVTTEVIGFVVLDRSWRADDRPHLDRIVQKIQQRQAVIEETRRLMAHPVLSRWMLSRLEVALLSPEDIDQRRKEFHAQIKKHAAEFPHNYRGFRRMLREFQEEEES